MNTVCASCHATNRVPQERITDSAKCGRCGSDLFNGEVVNATTAGGPYLRQQRDLFNGYNRQ